MVESEFEPSFDIFYVPILPMEWGSSHKRNTKLWLEMEGKQEVTFEFSSIQMNWVLILEGNTTDFSKVGYRRGRNI